MLNQIISFGEEFILKNMHLIKLLYLELEVHILKISHSVRLMVFEKLCGEYYQYYKKLNFTQ